MEKKQLPKTNHHTCGATHHLPHRTRYRLARRHRDPATFKQIQNSITALPGVKNVELNERTGSVLIHHEEEPNILSLLGKTLDGIAIDLCVEALAGEEMLVVSGVPVVANAIKSRLANINHYIAQRTHNYLDLKTLLPVLFLGAGIYQVFQNRTWWRQMPAWVLFYYAFDSYIKFHGPGVGYAQSHIPGNGQNGLTS